MSSGVKRSLQTAFDISEIEVSFCKQSRKETANDLHRLINPRTLLERRVDFQVRNLSTLLPGREMGLSMALFYQNNWQEQGQAKLDEGKLSEGLRLFYIAEGCAVKRGAVSDELLCLIAQTEYDLKQYKESQQTWDRIAKESTCQKALGYLMSALCSARLGKWEKFYDSFTLFDKTWEVWSKSEHSPLTWQQLCAYEVRIGRVIFEFEDVLESSEGRHQEGIESVICLLSTILENSTT